jgi:Ferritin-like domain
VNKLTGQNDSLNRGHILHQEENLEKREKPPESTLSRRTFLKSLAVGAATTGASLVFNSNALANEAVGSPKAKRLTKGDVAILTFLAAAEFLEADLWRQYNELGGIQDSELPGGSGSQPYTDALVKLDPDIRQYIHDNAEDELSHAEFINAYLVSKGVDPVNLDPFRQLPSSQATGAQQIGRLTNLMQLTIDTSWWTRYRSRTKNPDLGDTFAPAIPGLLNGKFPAIPRDDNDLAPADHIQAIANTAAFHFATIEQGGTSLYPALAQRVSNVEVLRILLSIGPTETAQFQTWHEKAGNVVVLTDPTNGLEFPDLNAPPFGGEDFSTNLILPEPTVFLNRTFPPVSIIRPTNTTGVATGVAKFLTDMGLFAGQSAEFFAAVTSLAEAADAA